MDIALWVAQAMLSLVFLGAGFSKLRTDHVTFAASSPPNSSFAEDLSERTFTTIGVLEVLGAVGVLLPWALDVTPVVTPVAAVGLAAAGAAAGARGGAVSRRRRAHRPRPPLRAPPKHRPR